MSNALLMSDAVLKILGFSFCLLILIFVGLIWRDKR